MQALSGDRLVREFCYTLLHVLNSSLEERILFVLAAKNEMVSWQERLPEAILLVDIANLELVLLLLYLFKIDFSLRDFWVALERLKLS